MSSLQKKKIRLVRSTIGFLKQEADSTELDGDQKEAIEVAVQCLETAYDLENKPDSKDAVNLLDLIDASTPELPEASEEDKNNAEIQKVCGNNCMKLGNYIEALDAYSKAIKLNPTNAVYYCNRAAAYSRLEKHEDAISDCKEAIRLDPSYGKAYGRLGIAYSNLNRFADARIAYSKALELDPANAMYEANLKLAEEKIFSPEAAGNQNPRGGPPPLDFAQFMNNPGFMNIASQMLNDPSFHNMVSSIMNVNEGSDPNLNVLIQAGHQLAAQMENTNPNFVENLRRNLVDPQGREETQAEPTPENTDEKPGEPGV